MNDMTTTEAIARRATRRAYELGRLRVGVVRAVIVTGVVAALAIACCGTRAIAWMPLTWVAWVAIEWRGGALREGGVRGLVAGAVTLVLPMTWLRACCAGMEHGAACTAPEACVIVGGAVGLALAIALPRASSARKSAEGAGGAVIGVLTVSAVRCVSLLGGEALGLALGLSAGIAAGAWLAQRRAATQ